MSHLPRYFLFFLSFAFAAPANPVVVDKEDAFRMRLQDWEFGDTLSGDKIVANKLKGKVVVVYYWAVGSPECEALLPRLAALDMENRSKGLVVIGAENKSSDPLAIQALLEKNKVEYSITQKAKGPPAEVESHHAYVFDVEGECIYDGKPDEPQFNDAVKRAIASVKASAGGSNRPSLLNDRPRNLIESRTWKNAEGREIIAAVKSADDKTVAFLLPNGQQTVYPLEKLSPESREVINAARAAAKTE